MKRKNNNKLLYNPNKRFERDPNHFFVEDENKEEAENLEQKSNQEEIEDFPTPLSNNDADNPSEESQEIERKPSSISTIKNLAANQAKQVVKDKIKKKIWGLILKNPWVLAILAGIIIIIFIIFIIMLAVKEDSLNGTSMNYYRYNKAYWWPVGSLEVEEIEGVEVAIGDPSVTYVSSGFGYRSDPFLGTKKFHSGIDIAKSPDNVYPIIAAKDGTVITVIENNSSYGDYIIIDHGSNEYTLYAHLYSNSIKVSVGDDVIQGQVIGKMGNTGRSTGTHLHFEIRIGSNNYLNTVDPLDYISVSKPRPKPINYDYDSSAVPLFTTSLTKSEFQAHLENYHNTLSGNKKSDFYNNFLTNADIIYDTSVEKDLNPEIVVIFAAIESGFAKCNNWYNFWGIGIANGEGCNDGPHITNMEDGVIRFAELLHSYSNSSTNYYNMIIKRYEERKAAGCNPNGYGPPDTLSGILSIYGWFGNYLANPGSWGDGGCVYIEYWKNTGFLSETYTEEYYNKRCGNHYKCASSSGGQGCVPTIICEQSDYTYYIVKVRLDYRKLIFDL